MRSLCYYMFSRPILKQFGLVMGFVALTVGGFATAHAFAQEEVVNPSSGFVIKVNAEPHFPSMLKNMGISEGKVRMVVAVNAEGNLLDYLVVEATHEAFARAVEEVVSDWSFVPPTENGQPYSIATFVDVNFRTDGMMVMSPDMMTVISLFYNLPIVNEADAIRVFSVNDLDRIPEPIYVEKPLVPVELLGDEVYRAVFEFYIDRNGNVHIPVLRNKELDIDERILVIAQDALWKWQFSPPTVKGRPVVVKVAQPLVFQKEN